MDDLSGLCCSVPVGQQILLNFTVFDMENHTNCEFDYLEIR